MYIDTSMATKFIITHLSCAIFESICGATKKLSHFERSIISSSDTLYT